MKPQSRRPHSCSWGQRSGEHKYPPSYTALWYDDELPLFSNDDRNPETLSATKTQIVPTVDAGAFIYYGNVGTLPFTVLDVDSFLFAISASALAKGNNSEVSDAWKAAQHAPGYEFIPEEFALEHNYPNPFNPSTNLRFDLPEAAEVRLDIFNVRGQLVRTLVNAEMQSGRHTRQWDGKNDAGLHVVSGMYIYH